MTIQGGAGEAPNPSRTWDRMLWLDGETLAGAAREGESPEEVRCRLRTDAMEASLERSRTDPFIATFGLHDDLVRRRARWTGEHPSDKRRRWAAVRLVLTAMLTTAALVVGMVLFGVLGIVVILLFVPIVLTVHENGRASFDETSCPDCGYDLSGVPDGIPRDRRGIGAGPRVCPECGCAGPLVPPPA